MHLVIAWQGWFVYSEFLHGCEGPQYVPGPGIVMHPFGAVSVSTACHTPSPLDTAGPAIFVIAYILYSFSTALCGMRS
jgi:hypothetical protein